MERLREEESIGAKFKADREQTNEGKYKQGKKLSRQRRMEK